jgi:HSP20 family molecular chaperone IbpA
MAETTGAVQKARENIAVKSATPEDFADRVQKAFDAISRRAFEIFEGNGSAFGHQDEDWLKAENELFHPVHIHVSESGETITLKAEVPGFNEKELQVTMEPTRLTISGKRESSKEHKSGATLYSETCSSEVFRVVELPAEVDTGKVKATLKDGILELAMPKAAARSRTVQVRPQLVA